MRASCEKQIFSQRARLYRKQLTMHESIQESLSSLRSRGGHGFPAFNAARLALRIATIFFACERVSSRRLARPPRRPISARYSCIFLSVPAIKASNIYRKPLTIYTKFILTFGRIVLGKGAEVRARHGTSPSDWQSGLALREISSRIRKCRRLPFVKAIRRIVLLLGQLRESARATFL